MAELYTDEYDELEEWEDASSDDNFDCKSTPLMI